MADIYGNYGAYTVPSHSNDYRKFGFTDEEWDEIIGDFVANNPRLRYSWETKNDYMYLKKKGIVPREDGITWCKVEYYMLDCIERRLLFRFGVKIPNNPYYNLTKDEFKELSRKAEELYNAKK